MARFTLYAYVDGADLDEVASILEDRFVEFVRLRKWRAGAAQVVNQRHGEETSTQPGDLPEWDLGINLGLPDPAERLQGWFTDVEAIAEFCGALHRESGRVFVIGIADSDTGVADDLFSVSTDTPDLEKLRAIVGVVDTDAN